MVETENLRTASAYINNQLLARGLLRDGQTIDFAGHGKSYDTSARIISIVNDLILRRDRDDQNRESLSTTLRSLRNENFRHVSDISKLEEKNSEAQRRLEISEAAEGAAKTQLKSADSTIRALKEQLARTKALVAQTRTSCATEVRRRDRQIDTLKKQLGEAGRARGARANPAITTITITGHAGEEPAAQTSTGMAAADEHSLRGESTVSLAKLSQSLSEENEAVLDLMLHTMSQLREMSGWERERADDTQTIRQKSLEDLSSELGSVMEHMRHILNNPSFVPIEEVEARQEEINRLKQGWVKMETRWKDAMLLIDGWRKRMAAGGSPIREDELKLGFRLGSVRLTDGMTSGMGESTLAPLPEEELEDEAEAVDDEDINEESDDGSEPDNYDYEEMRNVEGQDAFEEEMADNVPEEEVAEAPSYETIQPCEPLEETTNKSNEHKEGKREQSPEAELAMDDASRESSPLPEPPQLSPLRNSSSAGNRRSEQASSIAVAAAHTKQRGQATWNSTAAPSQRQRPVSSTIHVRKRGLEQPSRRPVRNRDRVGESRPGGREVRVTSLEEALLSRPARERLLQQQSRQSATEEEERVEEKTREEEKGEKGEEEKEKVGSKTESRAQVREQRKRDVVKTEESRTRRSAYPTARHRAASRTTPYKQLPRPAEAAAQQSPLTMSNIAAKLEASAANAARVLAKVKAAKARSSSTTEARRTEEPGDADAAGSASHARQAAEGLGGEAVKARDDEDVDPVKVDVGKEREKEEGEGSARPKMTRRKRDIRISSKRTSRRRSTLSPMELETLIAGTGQ